MTQPRILVTNDDGIYSEGLRKLAAVCRELGEVIIVAPDREQSAASHALTLNRPLRLLEIEKDEWIVDGTPTDCVNLAVLKLMKENRPDLIVSGINFGPNLGDDVTYSGTISAAFEGALLNIPSIAFSALIGPHFSFDPCAAFAASLVKILLDGDRDPRVVLNVNFPVSEFTGVSITRLGRRIY
jgi:5'-nucleotidase